MIVSLEAFFSIVVLRYAVVRAVIAVLFAPLAASLLKLRPHLPQQLLVACHLF
jgi:hypothetical protein